MIRTAGQKRKRSYKYPPRKRLRGLVPSYRGFQPRAFSQGEWKYVDWTISQASDQTGVITCINALTPGTGASQRIGMKVAVRSLEFKGQVRVTIATGVDQVQRYAVIIDRQCNGTGPVAMTDFWAANVYYSLRNLANRKRFKTVWDRMYSLNAAAEPDSQRCVKFYIKFRRPLIVEFNTGVAGTVADIVSNGLFFISSGQAPAGATAGSILGALRVRYTDM